MNGRPTRAQRRKAKTKAKQGVVVGGVLYRSSVTLRTSHKLTLRQRLRVLINGVVVIECGALVERDTGAQLATRAKFATLPLVKWIAQLFGRDAAGGAYDDAAGGA